MSECELLNCGVLRSFFPKQTTKSDNYGTNSQNFVKILSYLWKKKEINRKKYENIGEFSENPANSSTFWFKKHNLNHSSTIPIEQCEHQNERNIKNWHKLLIKLSELKNLLVELGKSSSNFNFIKGMMALYIALIPMKYFWL